MHAIITANALTQDEIDLGSQERDSISDGTRIASFNIVEADSDSDSSDLIQIDDNLVDVSLSILTLVHNH